MALNHANARQATLEHRPAALVACSRDYQPINRNPVRRSIERYGRRFRKREGASKETAGWPRALHAARLSATPGVEDYELQSLLNGDLVDLMKQCQTLTCNWPVVPFNDQREQRAFARGHAILEGLTDAFMPLPQKVDLDRVLASNNVNTPILNRYVPPTPHSLCQCIGPNGLRCPFLHAERQSRHEDIVSAERRDTIGEDGTSGRARTSESENDTQEDRQHDGQDDKFEKPAVKRVKGDLCHQLPIEQEQDD